MANEEIPANRVFPLVLKIRVAWLLRNRRTRCDFDRIGMFYAGQTSGFSPRTIQDPLINSKPHPIPIYSMHSEESTPSQFELFQSPTNRRGVITSLGLTGLAFAASSQGALAFLSRRNDDEPRVTVETSASRDPDITGVDESKLPADWMRRHGRNVRAYANFVDGLGLRTIRTHDVIAVHARQRGGLWNELPPRKWWPRMGYTLRVVERIALEMNEPVTDIVSAYRSPAYNARCGGRRGSWHQANLALDVRLTSRASRVTRTARSLRDQGLFKGGVGSYRNFTHIDARGENVNW